MAEKMIFVINSTGIVDYIEKADNGAERIRQIDADDFFRACAGIGAKTTWNEVTWPEHCVAMQVNGGNDVRITFRVEACRRAINYFGKDTFHVPFPELLFTIETKGGDNTVKEAWCFAVKDGKRYAYPFGNVDLNGHVCFGSGALKKVPPEKMFLEIIEREFFGRETNDDYFNRKPVFATGCVDDNGNPRALSQRELLSRLEDMTEFPTEWLIPIKGN